MPYDFILCTRNKKDNKFGTKLGNVTYLKIPKDEKTPSPSHKMDNIKFWFEAIIEKATINRESDLSVVFFIHGYNTDSEEALNRQRQVEKKLGEHGFSCVVVGFDWDSAGNVVDYLYDRTNAIKTATTLVTAGIIPFALYKHESCLINVNIIAHSMGAFVVREAFRNTDKSRISKISSDWKIGQLVLVAADISSDCFANADDKDTKFLFKHCGRLTNYFSGHDEVLAVSNIKNIDIDSRVGRVGMPTNSIGNSKALDVDCSQRYNSTSSGSSHSWYFFDEMWYSDLVLTLKSNIDRNLFTTRIKNGENDFELKS